MTAGLLPLILVIGFVFIAALVLSVVMAVVMGKKDREGRDTDIRGR